MRNYLLALYISLTTLICGGCLPKQVSVAKPVDHVQPQMAVMVVRFSTETLEFMKGKVVLEVVDGVGNSVSSYCDIREELAECLMPFSVELGQTLGLRLKVKHMAVASRRQNEDSSMASDSNQEQPDFKPTGICPRTFQAGVSRGDGWDRGFAQAKKWSNISWTSGIGGGGCEFVVSPEIIEFWLNPTS